MNDLRGEFYLCVIVTLLAMIACALFDISESVFMQRVIVVHSEEKNIEKAAE